MVYNFNIEWQSNKETLSKQSHLMLERQPVHEIEVEMKMIVFCLEYRVDLLF